MKTVHAALLCLLLPLTAIAAPKVEHYPSSGDAPYSDAVRVGDMLYLSGKLGYDANKKALVPGGIKPETHKALSNISESRRAHGSALGQVVKCTVFLADMAEWEDMNSVYRKFFASNPPARSAVGVNELGLDARVEIECIAWVR